MILIGIRGKNSGKDNRSFNYVRKNSREANESIRLIDLKHY